MEEFQFQRSRLEWRCRRGTHELDLLMQNWLRQGFDGSSKAEQQVFLSLLEWPDDALARLLLGQAQADDAEVNALAAKIRHLPLSPP